MFNLCQTIANRSCYWNVLYINNIKLNLDNLKKRHLGNLLQSSFTEIMWPRLYQIHFSYSALKVKVNPSLVALLLFSSVYLLLPDIKNFILLLYCIILQEH